MMEPKPMERLKKDCVTAAYHTCGGEQDPTRVTC